jgi:hypothetical protein
MAHPPGIIRHSTKTGLSPPNCAALTFASASGDKPT